MLRHCDLLELVLLPGGLFYSAAETVLFFLRKKRSATAPSRPAVTVRELRSVDLPAFRSRGSFTRTYPADYSRWADDDEARFVVSPLAELFDKLAAKGKTLGNVASIHNGLRAKHTDRTSVSLTGSETHDRPFVDRLDVLRPFALLTGDGLLPTKWLKYGDQLDRAREEYIFTSDKVLISANRNPGSSWRLVAAIDRSGLFFSDNFHGVIPKGSSVSPEEIAAVLNSPLANAWFDANCRKRKVVQATLRNLPFPSVDTRSSQGIRSLGKQLHRALVSAWKRQKEGLFYEGASADADVSQLV